MRLRPTACFGVSVIAITSLFIMVCAGCNSLSNGGGEQDDPPTDPPATNDTPSLDTLRVEFRNLATTAVSTQFYVADGPTTTLPDELLLPENLVIAGIGVGGTGILGPLSVDAVDLACSAELAIGTAGGEFLDADLGTPLGNGPVRFMQAGFQFDCGANLILEYRETIGGYTVNLYQGD